MGPIDPVDPVFSSFGGYWGLLDFCCSQSVLKSFQFVPIQFPMGSQYVPNSTSLCPICFAHNVQSSWNLDRWVNIGTLVYLCLEWLKLQYWGVFKVSKLFFSKAPTQLIIVSKEISSLRSMLLCTSTHLQLFFLFFYVPIWFLIVHHYLSQCQI
jgi:hypothetical protein